jgi:hypothetical protein
MRSVTSSAAHSDQEPRMSDPRPSLAQQARRRVGIKAAFAVHAFVYVVVNLGIVLVDEISGGSRWSTYPLLGWGLGLAIHGLVSLVQLRTEGLRERLVARELQRLRDRRV